MDPNKEVLRQIKESKAVGSYLLSNFTPSDHGVFNSTLGYGNPTGNTSRMNIDADSFLKNIHQKNTTKVIENPLLARVDFKPNVFKSSPINVPTKLKRSNNIVISSQDISNRYYDMNVMNLQNHIQYSRGIDSRHQKR